MASILSPSTPIWVVGATCQLGSKACKRSMSKGFCAPPPHTKSCGCGPSANGATCSTMVCAVNSHKVRCTSVASTENVASCVSNQGRLNSSRPVLLGAGRAK
ncbi:Uncharacterised protein [Vibrio cholerae]|nr:Uncharacterised protein [Vibrio cholerae]